MTTSYPSKSVGSFLAGDNPKEESGCWDHAKPNQTVALLRNL